MPVDYVRGEVINSNGEKLFSLLEQTYSPSHFTTKFNGEDRVERQFRSRNIQIKYFPSGRISFGGSLHKLSNDGWHNYNQFTRAAFDSTICTLEREFFLPANNMRLTGLEYGVNLMPPIDTDALINRCFQHKGVHFEEVISRFDGKYHRASHDAYDVKLYDKSLQNNLPSPLLRFEIKTTNWSRYRNDMGIVTLDDFIRADKTPFVIELVGRWQEVVFSDPTITYEHDWHEYTNREYWRALREGGRMNFHRKWANLKLLGKEEGQNIQGLISLDIETNIRELQ